MNIWSPELRKEDGTKIIVCLYVFEDCHKIKYKVSNINYCEPKKRTWKSLSETLSDKYKYSKLDMGDREKHKMQEYIDFVGKDMLEEAIIKAWENSKPDMEDILSM